MRSLCIYILLIALFPQTALCQTTSVISGIVADKENLPVPGATVLLLNLSDSTLAKAALTDELGKYILENINKSDYLLKVSLMGFDTHYQKLTVKDVSTVVPQIKINQASKDLKEVNVAGIRPLLEVKPDKTVFNVENSINSTGSTAYELLQKAPGVVIDQNENISMKGRGGVMVQIDGRPSQLSGEQLADLLKSLQSSDVEAIELITNPSSKYDAEGTAGIINLRLKKNKSTGTNGAITLGYSVYDLAKYNSSISLNHRTKAMNAFGTFGYNFGERQNTLDIYRVQNGFIYDQDSKTTRDFNAYNFKAGADFFAGKKHTFGILATGNTFGMDALTKSRTIIQDTEQIQPTELLISNSTTDLDMHSINFNLNYRYTDTLGREFNTDLDYGLNRNDRDSYQPNIYLLAAENTILNEKNYRALSPTDIDIYSIKSDYSQNFLKGKLGAGFKASQVITDNVYDFYNVFKNGTERDTTRSSHFEYTENIIAFYVNYQRKFGKFDFQAGLRAENTISEGDLKSNLQQNDKNVEREYFDLFPSAGITYEVNKKNSLGLTYSSRIDRPNYQELNPFEFKVDELTFRKGNPFLNPQYTDKIDLSHTWNYSITTTLSYSNTRDFFAQIADTIDGNKSYIGMRNLANEKVLSFDVSASLQPLKWWGIYANGTVYRADYEADFGEGKKLDVTTESFNFYIQNTIRLPKSFTFELSGNYNAPGVWGGGFKTTEQYGLDVGLQKKFWKDMASLKASMSDIFFTMPWSSRNLYSGTIDHANGSWESRLFRLSFSYRFGNTQMKGARQRSTGNETETKRTGGNE